MLRKPAVLERLLAALDGIDRLVLLGDAIELRGRPVREALAAARPVLKALGGALDGRELLLVPGNHDHALIAPWLDAREAPLGLEQRVTPAQASRAAAELLDGLPAAQLAYPGVWVREDVYAMHGHYLDVHSTVPSFERLAAGAMGRVLGGAGADPRRAEDYEAVLAPIYAWIHASAQRGSRAANSGQGARLWKALAGGPRSGRRRGPRELALAAAYPAAIAALNRAGIGPLRTELSATEIKRAALQAMGGVLERLEIRAAHAIFGHTHRTGPLGSGEGWCTPRGAQLHNTGSWVFEEHFMARAEPVNPYWPGGAVLVDSGSCAAPRGLRLLGDLDYAALAAPASKQTA